MESKEALTHLVQVLQTHGTTLTVEDVQWAFDNESTRDTVTSWVEEHLGQDTLLSPKEAHL